MIGERLFLKNFLFGSNLGQEHFVVVCVAKFVTRNDEADFDFRMQNCCIWRRFSVIWGLTFVSSYKRKVPIS